MKSKYSVTLFLIAWLTFQGYSQNTLLADRIPTNKTNDITILTPLDSGYMREHFRLFKTIVWFRFCDTLYRQIDGLLKGKSDSINPSSYKTVSVCDSALNYIRNTWLQYHQYSEVHDIELKRIGYNEAFHKGLDPTNEWITRKNTCWDDYNKQRMIWYDFQLKEIDRIEKEKQQRLEWIKVNPSLIDKAYMRKFIEDAGICSYDQEALLSIMFTNTNDFLIMCKQMDRYVFYDIKRLIWHLPSDIKKDKTIEKLKTSNIKTHRKRKLIRLLQKN